MTSFMLPWRQCCASIFVSSPHLQRYTLAYQVSLGGLDFTLAVLWLSPRMGPTSGLAWVRMQSFYDI